MKKLSMKFQFLLIFFFTQHLLADGFLKVSGKYIVNEQNQEVLLRGMGLGGWMLPEGYMYQMSSFANAPWEIKKKIVDVVGQTNANIFWTEFRKNFVQRKDIERLAQLGFNSVRMVLHWEFFINPSGGYLTEGFTMIDSVLRQCADNKMYVILDLHAAPGGQSANGISDYNPAYLSLWESEANKQATIDLWKKIAERYKDEPWIGGYDILNEPAWTLNPNNKPLRDLSIAITNAIRSVDTKHIIFVEGNWYATDFNGMAPAWDDNMVWSFHKYWNGTDINTINYLLTLRNDTNRPLWMGESGENSNGWFTETIQLLEANKIGWSWWTLKKYNTINGPFSIKPIPEYETLLKYWKGQTTKPSVEYSMNALMKLADGLQLENCKFNDDVIDAMFRQVYDVNTKPFAENKIPGKIFAVNYDLGRNGVAYKDAVYKNDNNSANWNNGWVYRNDGVDIETCSDEVTNGYNVGWIETGEFLKFTVNAEQAGKYLFSIRVACNAANGTVGLSVDNATQQLIPINQTGGWQTWKTQDILYADLTAGTHTLKLNFYFGGFNVNYLDVTYVGPSSVEKENIIPKEFSLSQNFPNPFNPVTTIQFSISKDLMGSFVTLKIYDALGREVTTLVNEEKYPGKYEVKFDASKLSSGLYFAKLQSGNKIQMIKMNFVK